MNKNQFPAFSQILPEKIEPALKTILNNNRTKLAEILTSTTFTWENLMAPIEEMGDTLSKMWSPVSHLNATMETDALRAAYNTCLPLLVEYHTELMQNQLLYQAIQSLANSAEYITLDTAQKKILENALRDFKLTGVGLPSAEKIQFAELEKQLSKLSTEFSENILDSTHAWSLHITDKNKLAGLPEQALQIAKHNAEEQKKSGWVLTLDYPCYSSAIKYLENRELRKELYTAYVTRASTGKWDNTQLMEDIVKTRNALANLVGFSNYAEYSLATKMAKTSDRVLQFLYDLVEKSRAAGKKDMQELQAFANTTLEAWDMAFYTEKLQQKKYALSEEDLRPYFPANKVLAGLFSVVNKLYGIKIIEHHDIDTWHPNVQFFEVRDEQNNTRGYFYTDLYARPHKREGAWMDECSVRRRLADGTIQHPIAFLTCNFTRPIDNQPALLTHDDVITTFHEFGHCLQHLMTQVDYAGVSGINGVQWDAVECPSQFLEHWCWEKESLALISSHYKTGEPTPNALYDKVLAAKNFQSGMQMLRQLEFSLFDFRLHLEYDPKKSSQVQSILDEVRSQVSVVPISAFNRFQHSFSHIFSGGYAAGYYSYKWAEVLSSDAFSQFEEKGIFDRNTGNAFLNTILAQGGTRDAMDLFIAFRGREPKIDALLRHSGLTV